MISSVKTHTTFIHFKPSTAISALGAYHFCPIRYSFIPGRSEVCEGEVLYQGHKYQTKSQRGKEGNIIFLKMLHQAGIEPAELAVEIAKCQTNSENSDILYDSVIIFTHSIEYNNDIILLEYNNVCHTKLLKLPRQITSALAYTMLQNIL